MGRTRNKEPKKNKQELKSVVTSRYWSDNAKHNGEFIQRGLNKCQHQRCGARSVEDDRIDIPSRGERTREVGAKEDGMA